jgi:SAM-dependent methyltransferase
LDQADPFCTDEHNVWRRAEYLGRYLFAADFLGQQKPKVVADISCGTGYGTEELCRVADAVVGVDSSQDLIKTASKRCSGSNASFLKKDLDQEDLIPEIEEGSVDAVVSFETIEHLVDPNRAISQFSKILGPGKFLICSVPMCSTSLETALACRGTGATSSGLASGLFQDAAEPQVPGDLQAGAVVVQGASQREQQLLACQED